MFGAEVTEAIHGSGKKVFHSSPAEIQANLAWVSLFIRSSLPSLLGVGKAICRSQEIRSPAPTSAKASQPLTGKYYHI